MNKSIKVLLALVVLGLVSCEKNQYDDSVDALDSKHGKNKKYKSGKADFSNFVAIGNSLTAGYTDSALYIDGQVNSYPNILAGQFAYAKGGAFTQPLMADNTGGALLGGNQILPNRFVLNGPLPSRYVGTPTTEISNVLTGPFNNMGVAGAKSFDLVANGYGNIANLAIGKANPFFVRMASSPNASMLEDAMAQNPTFFSLWIGNNDILSYAISGGVGVDHNVTGNEDPTTYGAQDITNIKVFRRSYRKLLRGLTGTNGANNYKKGTEGIVVNLPNVNSLSFFTTVPYNLLSPLNPAFAAQIPTLNATFAGLNQAFAALGVPERAIVFSETEASAVVVKDESLTDISANLTAVLTPSFGAGLASILGTQYGQARQATADDLMLLSSGGVIAQLDTDRVAELMGLGLTQEQAASFSVNGVSLPLGDEFVLTPDEQNSINSAVRKYNNVIYNLARKFDLAHLDAASDLDQIANGGIPYDGGVLTSDYITGGAVSLDGIHPSARGYAFLANRIMDEIEKKYKSRLPRVSLLDYPTIAQ